MFAFLTLALPIFLATSPVIAQTCTPCDDVHFFLARGNNEPYPGRQGALVAATCDGVANCGYENLIYSALYTDLSCQTTYDGVIAGFTQITSYADRCPDSKLILAGYSQGAQIVTDILGGGGGVSFNGCVQPNTTALDRSTSPGNRLNAIIAFGDTRHTANEPYNYGNGSADNGLFPRPAYQVAGITAYTDILRDWCDSPDPICAGNQTYSNVSTHLGYYNVYAQQAASWIQSVASITTDSNVQTTIPTSISGTVQDYATVGTATPSGTVTTAATTTASVSCASTSSSSSKASSSASATKAAGVASQSSPAAAASSTGSKSTSASSGRVRISHNLAITMAIAIVGFVFMI